MTTVAKTKKKQAIQDTIAIFAGFVLVGYLGGKALKKYLTNKTRDNEVNEIDNADAKAVTFATTLYSAFFQAGQEWWSDYLGDGTDEELAYSVAREMNQTKTTFAEVSKSYKILYKRDLLIDIQKELDSDEQKTFNNLLKYGIA